MAITKCLLTEIKEHKQKTWNNGEKLFAIL